MFVYGVDKVRDVLERVFSSSPGPEYHGPGPILTMDYYLNYVQRNWRLKFYRRVKRWGVRDRERPVSSLTLDQGHDGNRVKCFV